MRHYRRNDHPMRNMVQGYRRNLDLPAYEPSTSELPQLSRCKQEAILLRSQSCPIPEITFELASKFPDLKLTHSKIAKWVQDIAINPNLEKAWELKKLLEIAPLREVAIELGISEKSIKELLQKNPLKIDQKIVDAALHLCGTTKLPYREIAQKVGLKESQSVSVRDWCLKAGLRKAKKYNAPSFTPEDKKKAIDLLATTDLSPPDIARATRLTHQYVQQLGIRLGLRKLSQTVSKTARKAWKTRRQRPDGLSEELSERTLELCRKSPPLRDSEIAKQISTPGVEVKQYTIHHLRKRHNIPMFEAQLREELQKDCPKLSISEISTKFGLSEAQVKKKCKDLGYIPNRKKYGRYSKEQTERVKNLCQSPNSSLGEIANETGVSYAVVARICSQIQKRMRGGRLGTIPASIQKQAAALRKKGFTLREVADELKVSKSTVFLWEQTSQPYLQYLRTKARLLYKTGVPVEEIVGTLKAHPASVAEWIVDLEKRSTPGVTQRLLEKQAAAERRQAAAERKQAERYTKAIEISKTFTKVKSKDFTPYLATLSDKEREISQIYATLDSEATLPRLQQIIFIYRNCNKPNKFDRFLYQTFKHCHHLASCDFERDVLVVLRGLCTGLLVTSPYSSGSDNRSSHGRKGRSPQLSQEEPTLTKESLPYILAKIIKNHRGPITIEDIEDIATALKNKLKGIYIPSYSQNGWLCSEADCVNIIYPTGKQGAPQRKCDIHGRSTLKKRYVSGTADYAAAWKTKLAGIREPSQGILWQPKDPQQGQPKDPQQGWPCTAKDCKNTIYPTGKRGRPRQKCDAHP